MFRWACWWSVTFDVVSTDPWSQLNRAFVGFFREQNRCSVSSFTHTTWARDRSARGMGENSLELYARPLFVNLKSNASYIEFQWSSKPILIKHLRSCTGVPTILSYSSIYAFTFLKQKWGWHNRRYCTKFCHYNYFEIFFIVKFHYTSISRSGQFNMGWNLSLRGLVLC